MIITIMLCFTVVLNIGKYESVHSSLILDSFLNIKVEDFESFNVMCHHTIYTIIYTGIYNEIPEWINHQTPTDEWLRFNATWPMQDRIKIIRDYMIRLHRILYNGDNSKLKDMRKEIWTFYKIFVDWMNNDVFMELMCNYIKILISKGDETKIWNFQPDMFIVLRNYEYCTHRLMLLSRKSEDTILSEELNFIFYDQGTKYMDHPNANIEFSVSIQYGFILLLLKEEEVEDFMSSSDEKEKKIFVVDMMKEALLNTFFTIMMELKEIGSVAAQIRCIEFMDDESIVKLIILKSMFMKIIDATEAVFNIQEDRKNYSGILKWRHDGTKASEIIATARRALRPYANISARIQLYPNLKEEYNNYMDMVKSKFNQLCPELVKNEHKRDEEHLNKEIKILFPERLTVDNSIRVSLMSYFSVSTLGILPHNEPFMKQLIEADKSRSALLLELYAWMLNIKQYADLMKNGMSPEHKTQDTTMDQTQRFIDDRNFFKGFDCI